MPNVYSFDGSTVATADAPSSRPLRWAAWRPDGAYALLIGNRGEAYRYDGRTFHPVPTDSTHNLRGIDWSPDSSRALLAGNRGAVILFDGTRMRELPPATTENLRRVAWSPDGASALIIGNGGVVLRFDAASGALYPLPGDRAHTLRSIAWRPDAAHALIGGYASGFAGYPRPHALYRCDGRYTQALLTTDDEDDAVAISWRPGPSPSVALALLVAHDGSVARNKIIAYDGTHLRSHGVEAPGALLGAAWRPDGAYALLCGEAGTLLRYRSAAITAPEDGDEIEAIASGTRDTLVGPFWHPSGTSALLLKGPSDKVYTV